MPPPKTPVLAWDDDHIPLGEAIIPHTDDVIILMTNHGDVCSDFMMLRASQKLLRKYLAKGFEFGGCENDVSMVLYYDCFELAKNPQHIKDVSEQFKDWFWSYPDFMLDYLTTLRAALRKPTKEAKAFAELREHMWLVEPGAKDAALADAFKLPESTVKKVRQAAGRMDRMLIRAPTGKKRRKKSP